MTKEEIYNIILTEHAKESAINKIPASATSDTLGAIYRAISSGIKVFSDAIDSFKLWFEDVRYTAVSPSTAWMGYKATKYQHGDTLIFVNGIMAYATEDTTKHIINCASFSNENGYLYGKAAKLDIDTGLLQALTVSEYSGLTTYMNALIPCDSYLIIPQYLQEEIDRLAIEAVVYVDATKLSTTGQAQYDANKYPVIDAINSLLANYSNQNTFNSELSVNQIENSIRAVDGVKNVVIKKAIAIFNSLEVDFNLIETKSIVPNAGFFILKNDGVGTTTSISYVIKW